VTFSFQNTLSTSVRTFNPRTFVHAKPLRLLQSVPPCISLSIVVWCRLDHRLRVLPLESHAWDRPLFLESKLRQDQGTALFLFFFVFSSPVRSQVCIVFGVRHTVKMSVWTKAGAFLEVQSIDSPLHISLNTGSALKLYSSVGVSGFRSPRPPLVMVVYV